MYGLLRERDFSIILSNAGAGPVKRKEAKKMHVKERFLKYVAMETTSDENSSLCPSSEKEWALARMLADDMTEMGISGVRVCEHAYVYGFIPGNAPAAPAIGLIAHMDTSNEVSGANIRAREIHYTGGDVVLNGEKGIVMQESSFESLQEHVGHDLIITDGATLLGADDKAGIAEILTFCEYVLAHPEEKHGKICIAFTPDEEIGRGADLFDVENFGADFAYTLDGAAAHEIEYENFNAAAARVQIHGFSIHPGMAKNKMRNAARMAFEFHSMLPALEIPENTEGYEGFCHLCSISGEEQEAELRYIIRDHDMEKFRAKKARMQKIADYLNEKYGENTFELTLKDSYFNMREKVEERPEVIERAKKALQACGLTPKCVPIRGGTDGARLSFMGLVCPNLGTGGRNFHGIYEYASVQEMEIMVNVLKALVLIR